MAEINKIDTLLEVPERYARIDKANEQSFYMTDSERPFAVTLSVHSVGAPRLRVDAAQQTAEEVAELKQINEPAVASADEVGYLKQAGLAARFVLGGNMSTIVRDGEAAFGPGNMTSDERLKDARGNMNKHFKNLDIDPASVRILNPERDYSTPLTTVNVDEDKGVYNGLDPVRLEKSGDLLYTYDDTIVLAARPADCPIAIMTADTPLGRVNMLLHFAWKGAASGQYEDMKREFDKLGIDYESLKVYISPGGQAETFRYTNYVPDGKENPDVEEGRLFVDVTSDGDNTQPPFNFGIDTPNDVYEAFLDMGLDKKQVFLDTSDTTNLSSGYNSNSRDYNQQESGARGILTAQFEAPQLSLALNPNRPAPPEIARQIVTVPVEYIDFEGKEQNGEIEVNRKVAKDVKDFFVLAKRLNFPINKVVKSSDTGYEWDDDKLMADNTSSGFNYRFIKGTTNPSLHGLGEAFDVNTWLNPYIRYNKDGTLSVDPAGAVYDPTQQGVLTAEHPLVVFMKDRGWDWGGDWGEDKTRPDDNGRIDYQHFEKRIA